MKGKFLFWAFVITFAALTQLLVYYANSLNLPTLQAIVTNPFVLTYNIVIFAIVVFMFIWLIRQIRIEAAHEKETNRKEQERRDKKLVKAFKQAMKKALEEGSEKGAK